MNKLLDKIWEIFYNSKIGAWYLEFLLWREGKKIKTDKRLYTLPPQIVKNSVAMLYEEGISNMRHKINSLISARTKEEYHRVLSTYNNMIELSESDKEEKKKRSELLKTLYVYKDADIKTSLDRAKMIDERISHFNELQNYKVEKELIRQIRIAERSGNKEELEKLQKEWKDKYGKKRRFRSPIRR